MSAEEWRPVANWPDFQVSSFGRVRTTVRRGKHKARIMKCSESGRGYRLIQTSFGGKKAAKQVHRLVCESFHGPAPSASHQVRHLDGDRANNHFMNLAWGTGKENAADRRRHNRDYLGSLHPNSKIDEHDIIAIFCLARLGLTGLQIGRLFKMNRNTVNKILARTAWAHLEIPPSLIDGVKLRNSLYSGSGAHWARRAPAELYMFGETA